MTAPDRFAECCRYVDFKRELRGAKIVTYVKGAHFWDKTLSLGFRSRQCCVPFPKQKSRIRWPRYMEDEPNRTEIAIGTFS